MAVFNCSSATEFFSQLHIYISRRYSSSFDGVGGLPSKYRTAFDIRRASDEQVTALAKHFSLSIDAIRNSSIEVFFTYLENYIIFVKEANRQSKENGRT